MSLITNATETLLATARATSSTDADLNAAAQEFFDAIPDTSLEDANAAIRTLSNYFNLEDASRAAFLALVCGTMVESGCDPLAIARPLTDRINSLLESSAALADACIAEIPEVEEEDADPIELFEETRNRIALTLPEQNADWEALEQFWPPAIAVFSASAEARAAARPLRNWAAKISEYHQAGHWLGLILSVLENEPIVAIEPQTKLGILAQISGVVDNFQLNVLLMDKFPHLELFAGRRIPQQVVDVATGEGLQETNDTVTGVWNMYAWQAIQPGLTLPNADDYSSSRFWIWNEGIPEDIPLFDGRRAILLGPASYKRTWTSQRIFANLRGSLEIQRQLTRNEIDDWLERMVAAKNPN